MAIISKFKFVRVFIVLSSFIAFKIYSKIVCFASLWRYTQPCRVTTDWSTYIWALLSMMLSMHTQDKIFCIKATTTSKWSIPKFRSWVVKEVMSILAILDNVTQLNADMHFTKYISNFCVAVNQSVASPVQVPRVPLIDGLLDAPSLPSGFLRNAILLFLGIDNRNYP